MRIALTLVAGLLGINYVHAGSIDVVTSDATEYSIERIRCEACQPLRKKRKAEPEAVTLTPGTQKIELREVNGEMKIFRTEAWLGGSPVTFVSKAFNKPALAQTDPVEDNAGGASVIDRTARTSAVSAEMGATDGATATQPASVKFDPAGLELRAN